MSHINLASIINFTLFFSNDDTSNDAFVIHLIFDGFRNLATAQASTGEKATIQILENGQKCSFRADDISYICKLNSEKRATEENRAGLSSNHATISTVFKYCIYANIKNNPEWHFFNDRRITRDTVW